MKVAIIHDWLTGMRGAEKGLEALCELFPQADLFTLVHTKGSVSTLISQKKIKASFLQYLPAVHSKYRYYLPFYPMAIESFNLDAYDLIISHSHCVAKGVKVPDHALHICYCYTPMRYAWLFFDEYFGQYSSPVKKGISSLLTRLRRWDIKTNERVNYFIACSQHVRKRIYEFYGRNAEVIYPPVEVQHFTPEPGLVEDFYLVVSAMVPYKRVDLAVEAFNRLGRRLVVIGSGPCAEELKKKAKPNIEFLGWGQRDLLKNYYSRAKALIFPGEEDFGIIPVEVQACGRPVIAYEKGGAVETVRKDKTGVFFKEQTVDSLIDAVERFEKITFDSRRIRENALAFDREYFKKRMYEFIMEKYETHKKAELVHVET